MNDKENNVSEINTIVLKITAFNYRTGEIEKDIIPFWKKIHKNGEISKEIINYFNDNMSNYTKLYYGLKSTLPRSENYLTVFLKEFILIKSLILSKDKLSFSNFKEIANITFNKTNLKFFVTKEFAKIERDFDSYKPIVNDLLTLEADIDIIIKKICGQLNINFSILFNNTPSESTVDDIEDKSLKNTISNLEKKIIYLEKNNLELTRQLVNNDMVNLKDFFNKIDDENLDFPFSNLYLANIDNLDYDIKKLKSYLNNFFLALEKNEIRPVNIELLGNKVNIKEEKIFSDYRINGKLSKSSGKFIYPGWQFKNTTLLLPLVTQDKGDTIDE